MKAELSRDGLMITYIGCTLADLVAHWQRVAGGAFTPDRLVSFIGDPTSERFDDLVPPDLLGEAYVREFLNISGAREALQSFI